MGPAVDFVHKAISRNHNLKSCVPHSQRAPVTTHQPALDTGLLNKGVLVMLKGIVRCGVITALAGGAAVLVAGPQRVGALVCQTRDTINCQIDKAIDDPVALRAQLHDLEAQYPAKIGEVRSDLSELKQQVSQLNREREIGARVVELADADLNTLQPMLARAEETRAGSNGVYASSDARPTGIVLVFNNEKLDVQEAYARADHARQVRGVYAARVNDIDRDLGYLGQQEQRLAELLTQLETERESFQSQMWALDRQIDAIGRNDRLIEILEKRQESIERHSRYQSNSLEQLTARFSEIRSKQEAQLEGIGKAKNTENYENRAKVELDARNVIKMGPLQDYRATRPNVIEIRPDAAVSPTSSAGRRID